MDLRSHRAQLVFTALAASTSTAIAFGAYTAWERRRRRADLGQTVQHAIDAALPINLFSSSGLPTDEEDIAPAVQAKALLDTPIPRANVPDMPYNEELTREQLARNYAFFGEEGMERVRAGRVAIIGCGGVGSWAAVMLARSGIAKLRLVDFDQVTLSSLNRHATANLSDVGTSKVKALERYIKSFARWIEVDARSEIWRKEEGGILLEDVDWVIDCIDNIDTKVDLLAYCVENGVPVFSSMGAGAKRDPSRIQIADLSSTHYDPLARSVRRRLRARGISAGMHIPVVYSTEVPGDVALLPLPAEEFEKGKVKELAAFDDFRVRILPVLGPLPAIFGLNAATYVLCELAGKKIENPLPVKNRRKLYERLLRDLIVREGRIAGDPESVGKLPIDEEDVALIFEDVHGGRSVLPPHHVAARPALTRWDPLQPPIAANIVVMETSEADKHVRLCFGIDLATRVGGQAKKLQFHEAREEIGSPESGLGREGPILEMRRPVDVWGEEAQRVVQRRAKEVERCRMADVP